MNFKLNYEGFDNYLYGASVIKAYWTYGGMKDLWELAVIRFFGEENSEYKLDYDTEITDNVCGYNTDDYKYDDIVTLYRPGYEAVGGPIQTALDSCRGRIEGLQLAINELKKEL